MGNEPSTPNFLSFSSSWSVRLKWEGMVGTESLRGAWEMKKCVMGKGMGE